MLFRWCWLPGQAAERRAGGGTRRNSWGWTGPRLCNWCWLIWHRRSSCYWCAAAAGCVPNEGCSRLTAPIGLQPTAEELPSVVQQANLVIDCWPAHQHLAAVGSTALCQSNAVCRSSVMSTRRHGQNCSSTDGMCALCGVGYTGYTMAACWWVH